MLYINRVDFAENIKKWNKIIRKINGDNRMNEQLKAIVKLERKWKVKKI